ncbi:MaoC family dehydratase N-terminal domain-containing protein [Streptomyces sp. NPDC014894]|uniref:FAS1-like dehydratase domain-containing protein n=1 Tax=unclassified Streptomyces TaxID=2593676 RepID=UPI0036F76CE2
MTAYEFPVDHSKIREFAAAVKSEHPAHRAAAPVIPPTMLTSARLIWEDPERSITRLTGFDRSRILHGEEEYVFHGPLPRAGQTLHCDTRVTDRFEKPGKRGGVMKFAKLVTEFRDEHGVLVAEQNSTIVETARPPKTEEEQA